MAVDIPRALGSGGRRLAGAGLAAVLISALVVMATGTPASASVTSVSGRAYGYHAQVGFFGGPQSLRGFGQVVCTAPNTPPMCVPDPQRTGGPSAADAETPSVVLPAGGSATITQSDLNGAIGVFGPASIFENHGTITTSTEGTVGAGGSVTSSAQVNDIQPQDPFTAPAPGGVSSTCTATETGLSGSTTITNGRLVLEDPNPDIAGEPGEVVVTPPTNPAPGTEYKGVVANVNDVFTVVFNEQIRTPDGITVNAVHMYMEGPTAVGDMVMGQSQCGVVATTANAAPVANDDAYSTGVGQALTVPAAGVLANDSDPEAGALTASKIPPTPPPTTGTYCPDPYPVPCDVWGSPSKPANGSLTLNANGSFTYTPNAGFAGTDSFTYTASDPRGKSDTAVVTIAVTSSTYLSVNDVYVTEGNAGTTTANFTITRSGNTAGSTTVSYKTTNGTAAAPGDYTAIALTPVTFAAGETTKPVAVTVVGNATAEANETFNLVLSAASGATVSDTTGVGTIINDDGWSTLTYLSVSDAVVTEGNAGTVLANFTITRTGNTAGSTTVSYKTTDGTATVAAGDYTAIALTPVTFAAGETTKPVEVSVTGDAVDELNETFTVNLSAATTGTTIMDTAGTGTIVDDDGAITSGPTTFFSVSDVSVTEGNTGTTLATFTVTRSGNTAAAGSVKTATANTTATAPADYTAKASSVLSFAAGETAKTVSINVVGDTLAEANETFKLNLTTPVGGVISDTSGTGTIVNDDLASVRVSDVSLTEGNAGTKVATFVLTRSGSTAGPSTVSYKTTNGTAAAGSDYTAIALTPVTFTAGETTKVVSVTVAGDATVEPNETFTLNLSSAVTSVISDTAGTATIVNDD